MKTTRILIIVLVLLFTIAGVAAAGPPQVGPFSTVGYTTAYDSTPVGPTSSHRLARDMSSSTSRVMASHVRCRSCFVHDGECGVDGYFTNSDWQQRQL